MEKWKDIDGFPGYKISTLGRVKGIRKELLKPVESNQGYLKVTLSKNGQHVDKRINRLVAEAFLPNPNELPVVMHLDNNRKNNIVDNLEWGTHAENNQWMYTCERHPITLTDEQREMAYSVRRKPVYATCITTGQRLYFDSQHDAARALDVSQQHIWGVLNGYRRSTGGYTFEYAPKRGDVGDD